MDKRLFCSLSTMKCFTKGEQCIIAVQDRTITSLSLGNKICQTLALSHQESKSSDSNLQRTILATTQENGRVNKHQNYKI